MTSARVSSDLFVTRVTDLPSLADGAAEWNRLAGDVPFRRWEWVESWWRNYGRSGASPYVLTVRNADGRLVGILPCYISNNPLTGRLLRLMGSGEICSDYLSILAEPEYEREAGETIGRWLSKSAVREWDVAEFDGVDERDPAMNALTDWLRIHGHRVYRRSRVNGWRLQLPGTWEEYLAKVSKGRRVRIRQIVKRQFETGRAVGRVAQTAAEYERGWQIFCELHQRRRISLGETGCFVSDRFAQFHAEVSRRFFDAGRLRLHWVELEGVPVAVDYAFLGDETVYCYQSGLHPDYLEEQPGWLDWTDSIRRAIEQGYRGFDFMRGDEPYKSIWRAEPTPLLEIRIVGRHASALIRDQLWNAGKSAKGALGAAKRSVQQWWPSRTKPTGEAPTDAGAAVEHQST
jgi:CelD/BcsL family acetyltransferase involved in cellulose biosynthesis